MKVFLDLDGVLADFVRGSLFLHGLDYEKYDPKGEWDVAKVLGITEEEFWIPMNHFGEAFWEHLHWTEDGRDILQLVESCFGIDQVCLLSSPSDHPGSASGKLKWIRRNLPGYSRRYLLGPSKGFVAGAGKLLIDDRDHNVEVFRKAGGEAILVPRPWNSCHEDHRRSLETLSSSLDLYR